VTAATGFVAGSLLKELPIATSTQTVFDGTIIKEEGINVSILLQSCADSGFEIICCCFGITECKTLFTFPFMVVGLYS
jgi:hypothetical protein